MADINTREDNVIASYDFQDIEDNSGTVTYYLFSIRNSGGTPEYFMDKDTDIISDPITLDAGVNGDISLKTFTSGTFNTPRIIEGTALCIFGVDSKHTAGGASNTLHCNCSFYHWDGSTETQIGSTAQTKEQVIDSIEVFTPYTQRITLPRTKFRRGDMIRFKFEVNIAINSTYIQVGIDPNNNKGTKINPGIAGEFTTFALKIPFRINR